MQQARRFRADGSEWVQVPGKASDSPEAVRAYRIAQKVIATFPDRAALERAGFKRDDTHFEIPRDVVQRIAGEKPPFDMGRWVIDRATGKTTQAQMDSTFKGTDPPQWPGVQWHQHSPGHQWMLHVDITKPIDQAFIEKPA